jgi:hypothetical protein
LPERKNFEAQVVARSEESAEASQQANEEWNLVGIYSTAIHSPTKLIA